jgi:FkbM family methyltransferase
MTISPALKNGPPARDANRSNLKMRLFTMLRRVWPLWLREKPFWKFPWLRSGLPPKAFDNIGLRFAPGVKLSLRPSDIGHQQIAFLPQEIGCSTAFIDIFLDDCYGLETFYGDITHVLDIGSHAGLFSLAAKKQWPGATIHAYEPNPDMAEWITQQAAVAHFKWYSDAVGKEPGRVDVQRHIDSVQTRMIESRSGDIMRVSFSAALERLGGKADLVKLDCEGAEWEILDDAASWKNVAHLTMEYHLWAGYALEELLEKIGKFGMTVTSVERTGSTWGILRASNRVA